MVKLVLYTENYSAGGLEKFIFDLLKSNLFNIHIVVNSENIRVINFAKENNIDYTSINLSNFRFKYGKSNLLNKIAKLSNFIIYNISMLPNYFKIKKVFKKLYNYENLLVVNGGYPAGLSSLSASVAGKEVGFKRVGLSILSSPTPHYRSRLFSFYQKYIDIYVGKYIDFYIPNSKQIESDLIELTQIDREKINVIYTGVEIPNRYEKANRLELKDRVIQKRDGDIWISMIALLGSTKRQDILIDILPHLSKNIKLLLVGDGNRMEEYKNRVQELNLSNRVIFTNWISNIDEVYQFIDMVVFLSNHEGLPYSISEAMSYRVPIIASSVGGVPEQIIDGKGGVLVKNSNIDDIIMSIERLCQDKIMQDNFKEFSFKRVKNLFSIDSMSSKILKLYKS